MKLKTAADLYFFSSHGSGSEESQARQHSRRTGRQRTIVRTCDVRSSSKQHAKFSLQINLPVLNI
jgi:hypothetical protein